MTGSIVKSAQRVFDILEYIREVRGPVRLKDVSHRLSLPISSTAALLKTMMELGYLTYELGSRAYLPTHRITELGDWIPDLFDQSTVAELMRALHERTKELIMLGTVNDIYVQYLKMIRSTHPFQYYVEPGTKRLLIRSGHGWALLAGYDDGRIESIYEQSVYRGDLKKNDWSLAATMENVHHVREFGYALSHGTVQAGASVVAMPLVVQGRYMSIGISAPTIRFIEKASELVTIMQHMVSTYFSELSTLPSRSKIA